MPAAHGVPIISGTDNRFFRIARSARDESLAVRRFGNTLETAKAKKWLFYKSNEGRVEWSRHGCQRCADLIISLKYSHRDCCAQHSLVCSEHDAVQKETPRRPHLLQELLQLHQLNCQSATRTSSRTSQRKKRLSFTPTNSIAF